MKNKKKSRLRIIYVCKTFGCYSITTTTKGKAKKKKNFGHFSSTKNFPFFFGDFFAIFVRQHESIKKATKKEKKIKEEQEIKV